jgi:hypothetical protein
VLSVVPTERRIEVDLDFLGLAPSAPGGSGRSDPGGRR